MIVTCEINGQKISETVRGLAVPPGRVITYDLKKKIQKNRQRHYVGYMSIYKQSDADTTNNQTTLIEVVNYLGIPFAAKGDGMQLGQNYPNPFDNATRIDFYLPTAGSVRFFVMDDLGRMIYQKVQDYDEGDHSINYQADGLTTGVYYYGIEMDGQRLMRRMVLTR